MFNLLLALMVGLIIGWNFHSYFLQLNPTKILKNHSVQVVHKETPISAEPTEVSSKKIKEEIKIVKKPIPKVTTEVKIAIPKTNTFYDFLHNDLFSDAMILYIDASEAKLLFYQPTLLKYFELEVKKNPQKSLEEMLEFQELTPDETKVNIEILDEIEENNYAEKAKILFELIRAKIDKSKEYPYQIPLKRIGDHFTITVRINNQPITLLLDTGATLTMVNEKSLPLNLMLLKENILLNTAGGKINAQLKEASTFSVGEIELEKFQIVSSTFKQKEADGLLGMNFFKKFKFKIDQEKAILFLSEKE